MENNMEELKNEELESVTDFAAPQTEEKAEVVTTDNEVKSLGKDLAEMAVVGVIIYAFCKLCDFIIDKVKAGVKKFKEKRAEKKAQKQAQQAAAPVAQVANVQATEAQATENVENKQ